MQRALADALETYGKKPPSTNVVRTFSALGRKCLSNHQRHCRYEGQFSFCRAFIIATKRWRSTLERTWKHLICSLLVVWIAIGPSGRLYPCVYDLCCHKLHIQARGSRHDLWHFCQPVRFWPWPLVLFTYSRVCLSYAYLAWSWPYHPGNIGVWRGQPQREHNRWTEPYVHHPNLDMTVAGSCSLGLLSRPASRRIAAIHLN